MTGRPILRAILGAMACVLCGAVAAQERGPHGGGGGGGREGGYHRSEGGGYGRAQSYGRVAPFGGGMERREPGGPLYGYPTPSYAPPRYTSPPLRRPFQTLPGWRAAPEPGPRGPRMASLGWVIESLQRRTPGRQLDAEIGYLGDRPVYRVLWVTAHGRRMDYIVDAETGVVLSGR